MKNRKRKRRHLRSLVVLVLLLPLFLSLLSYVRNQRRPSENYYSTESDSSFQTSLLGSAINEAVSRSDALLFGHGHRFGGRRFVVVTAATYSYRHLTANMLCSLRKTGAPYVLISLDPRVHAWAISRNYTAVHMNMDVNDENNNNNISAFGTDAFNQVTRDKVSAVVAVLSTGTDVLYVDSDVYFCTAGAVERIIIAFSLSQDIDMVTQRSHVLHQPINSGIYYVRSTPNAIAFLQREIVHNKELRVDEQVLFNRLLCRKGTVIRNHTTNYPVGCNSDTVRARFLDADSFPIGCTRLAGKNKHLIEEDPRAVDALCRTGGIDLLHFSCVEGGRKVSEMRRRGMWSLSDSDVCAG